MQKILFLLCLLVPATAFPCVVQTTTKCLPPPVDKCTATWEEMGPGCLEGKWTCYCNDEAPPCKCECYFKCTKKKPKGCADGGVAQKDSSQPKPDVSQPKVDSSQAQLDASQPKVDSQVWKKDASQSKADASVVKKDAGVFKQDSLAPKKDTLVWKKDAGYVKTDTLVWKKDAGYVKTDIASVRADAISHDVASTNSDLGETTDSSPGNDSQVSSDDASASSADAGSSNPSNVSGGGSVSQRERELEVLGGCSITPKEFPESNSSTGYLLLAALLIFLLTRRRA